MRVWMIEEEEEVVVGMGFYTRRCLGAKEVFRRQLGLGAGGGRWDPMKKKKTGGRAKKKK